MRKLLAWLAVGFVSGVSIRAWLLPAAAPPIGSESAATLRAAVAERGGEYSGLSRRVGALEISSVERVNEHAALIKRIAALEDEARSLADALAAASNQPSGMPTAASSHPRDGALALQFWSGPPGALSPTDEDSAAPLTLAGVDAEPGNVLVFEVTGSADGVIFGTDVYTDDSPIAVAAVHSGALRPNETGTIMVSVVPGKASYAGSSRYGIESQGCAAWSRSYTLRRLQ